MDVLPAGSDGPKLLSQGAVHVTKKSMGNGSN